MPLTPPLQRRASSPGLSETIQAFQQHKDKESFRLVFQYYAPRLQSWLQAHSTTLTIIEEVQQDTWLKVWRAIDGYDPNKGAFSTWLFRIARNTLYDRVNQTTLPTLPESYLDGVTVDGLEPENISSLHQALKTLPPEQYQIVYELFFRGQTQEEIAQDLNVPLGTVKSRCRLAFNKLRDMLILGVLWFVSL